MRQAVMIKNAGGGISSLIPISSASVGNVDTSEEMNLTGAIIGKKYLIFTGGQDTRSSAGKYPTIVSGCEVISEIAADTNTIYGRASLRLVKATAETIVMRGYSCSANLVGFK